MIVFSRAGRRWRQDSLWLHVEERNSAGLGLYQAAGELGIARCSHALALVIEHPNADCSSVTAATQAGLQSVQVAAFAQLTRNVIFRSPAEVLTMQASELRVHQGDGSPHSAAAGSCPGACPLLSMGPPTRNQACQESTPIPLLLTVHPKISVREEPKGYDVCYMQTRTAHGSHG